MSIRISWKLLLVISTSVSYHAVAAASFGPGNCERGEKQRRNMTSPELYKRNVAAKVPTTKRTTVSVLVAMLKNTRVSMIQKLDDALFQSRIFQTILQILERVR